MHVSTIPFSSTPIHYTVCLKRKTLELNVKSSVYNARNNSCESPLIRRGRPPKHTLPTALTSPYCLGFFFFDATHR